MGRKRDCRNEDLESDLDSDFGVRGPSLLGLPKLPKLLMRKKFLIFVGRCVLLSLEDFLEEKERPEKFRFSVDMTTLSGRVADRFQSRCEERGAREIFDKVVDLVVALWPAKKVRMCKGVEVD